MAPTSPAADQLLSGSDSTKSQITSPAMSKKRARSVDENSENAVSSGEDETALALYQVNENRNRGTSFVDVADDILDEILARFEYKDVFRAKTLSKLFKTRIEGDGFITSRTNLNRREGLLTALHFSVVRGDGVWRCAGYDLDAKAWKKLPPFAMLPRIRHGWSTLDLPFICGAGGIMCVYYSEYSSCKEAKGVMVVFNPLTGRMRELPRLNHRRDPELLHMVVYPAGDSFKVVAAGARRFVDNRFARITEVFDSSTSMWTVTGKLPGRRFPFPLHGIQTGAYKDGIVYCSSLLRGDRGIDLLAYSVKEGKWFSHLACSLPIVKSLIFSQVTNIDGELVVFSETEVHGRYADNGCVEHRIDRLDNLMLTNSGTDTVCKSQGKWTNLTTYYSLRRQARFVPHCACVPFGEGKVCIFETQGSNAHTGVIFDIKSGGHLGQLSSPTWNTDALEVNYNCCNSVTFTFEPSFLDKVLGS